MHVINCAQYSPEWWAARRGVPSSSNGDKIITPKTGEFSSQATGYACELIGDRYDHYYGEHDEYATAAMKNGSIMEPESRRFYEFERDCEVQQVGFVLSDDKRFGCSPDSLCGEAGGLELKNPQTATHVRYLIDGGLPLAYRPQVHWSLIVTGREWWDFLSYSAGLPPLLVRVVPDDFTEKLRGCMEQFWTLYQDLLHRIESSREAVIEAAIAQQEPEPSYW